MTQKVRPLTFRVIEWSNNHKRLLVRNLHASSLSDIDRGPRLISIEQIDPVTGEMIKGIWAEDRDKDEPILENWHLIKKEEPPTPVF
jgi:hypothetical protein